MRMTDVHPTKDNVQPNGRSLRARTQVATLPPIFLYGTLMSQRILAEALTGDEKQTTMVEERRIPVTLHGYSRHAVVDADFPALVKGTPTDRVEGFLFFPRSIRDVKRLDDFECDSYRREEVEVIDANNVVIKSYTYLWCDELDDLEAWDWNFDECESKWLR